MATIRHLLDTVRPDAARPEHRGGDDALAELTGRARVRGDYARGRHSCAMIVAMFRLAFLGLLAFACTYRPPTFTVSHSEKRGRLDHNGMRFVIMPDPGARLAEVAMRYDVGAEDDPDGKAGLAHLVEHLMFILRPTGEATNPVVWYLDL